MPSVPGQQEPGQAEPIPEVFQPTGDTAPAAPDGGVGLPVAGQAETVTPEVPAQPPVQFSDLTNTEAQGSSAQVEAAAAAPAVPAPPLPEASPFPPSEGVQPPSPDSASSHSPAEAPATGNAQDAAEQARADTTVHIGDELSAVGSEMAQGGTAPLPPQEIGAAPVAPPSPVDVSLPPEPPSGPIEPTAEAAPVAPEMPPSEIEQLINEADELVVAGEHNTARMREIMTRLRELQGQDEGPASPVETGQSKNQVG